ncbi:glucose-induced degradation protein 4 [Rhypophila decipiens]|uniref:Glucose-induced degradation protein 4 n=1 Tax=Rhypophila decipiens TaxID=261697 RepID=A0AAN7B976_9PEZI|nr:glucose-induced degradation protein 4 [Rhypophila decipiens]
MPTPSSNAPDPESHSSRTYPFSSCPDPDEQPLQSQVQSQSDIESHTETQSGWTARASPAYSPDADTHTLTDLPDDATRSRSITMSPGPQADGSFDIDMGREAEGIVTGQNHGEDRHKLADEDDIMLPVDTRHSNLENTNEADGDINTTPTATSSSTSAQGAGNSRRGKAPEVESPATAVGDLVDEMDLGDSVGSFPIEDSGLVGMGYELMHRRLIPTSPSSYLRPGSKFTGTQQSERQRYDVQVEIKNVDMRESFLCGYLRIQGLTDDHPTLTTYFEGEIIGSKYGFITQHPDWGATDKIDLSHWSKFAPFRPWAKLARKGQQLLIPDLAGKENIFMRWKEHFLVPNHRVRTINGASFEGFYYICFNQLRGEISGIYFHSKSEKFQQLELKHVEDKGCFGALEFR